MSGTEGILMLWSSCSKEFFALWEMEKEVKCRKAGIWDFKIFFYKVAIYKFWAGKWVMSFLIVWFCWTHVDLESKKRKPKCCNGDMHGAALPSLVSSSCTIFNLILKNGHKLSFTQSCFELHCSQSQFWIHLKHSNWFLLIVENPIFHHITIFLKNTGIFLSCCRNPLWVYHSTKEPASPGTSVCTSCHQPWSWHIWCTGLSGGAGCFEHLHVHFQLWVVQQFLGFCVGVTPRNMQTMPCREHLPPVPVWGMYRL